GALYDCQDGNLGDTNNCRLLQACAIGCITGPTTGTPADTCFSGPQAPLTLSPTSTAGGNNVTLTAALADSHANGAIVNLTVNTGDLVPGQYCAVPDLLAGQTSVSFALPTAVVPSVTPVSMYVNIAYSDASGISRQLVSVPANLTLSPGGTAPPPPP